MQKYEFNSIAQTFVAKNYTSCGKYLNSFFDNTFHNFFINPF